MIPTNLQADCVTDLATCRLDGQRVIKSAQDALKAKDDVILSQTNAIDDLTRGLNNTKSQLDSETDALNKWYHSPIILPLLGALVGGFSVVYLLHR